jgi:hypothetical protein
MKILMMKTLLLCAALIGAAGCGTLDGWKECSYADEDPCIALRRSLSLYASFDYGVDAEFAAGDPTLYTAPSSGERNGGAAVPGLPEEGFVEHRVGEGRFGSSLLWTKKAKPVVFYRGGENMAHRTNDWSASVSLWMRLNPDKDLESGYCDPLQLVGKAWGGGSFFIEFTKENPRHFRFVQMAITKIWNPTGAKYEEIPLGQRPLVQVENPPFGSSEWTHVVFTFVHANTGQKDGVGKLYLNGEFQGAIAGFESSLDWAPEPMAINLGLNYIGGIDDLAVFDRELSAAEIRLIHAAGESIGDLID